jgi:catechol 2,3-dioxygenase-like lactoylglutathione lyase family enzyme
MRGGPRVALVDLACAPDGLKRESEQYRKWVEKVIGRIENITLRVADLKKAVGFYENVLGLKKRDEWSNCATFNIGDIMLGLDPDPKGELDIFVRVADVDGEYRALKERGVQFLTEPKDQYWGGRTAKFIDPDGNKFILVSYKEGVSQTNL